METFLEYYGSKASTAQKTKWQPKHSVFKTDGELRKNNGGITDPNKTNLLAQSRTHEGGLHPAVEKIRDGQSQMEVLSPADVQQITAMYGISDLDEQHPKTLSNMPITISFNPQLGKYTLIKNG